MPDMSGFGHIAVQGELISGGAEHTSAAVVAFWRISGERLHHIHVVGIEGQLGSMRQRGRV